MSVKPYCAITSFKKANKTLKIQLDFYEGPSLAAFFIHILFDIRCRPTWCHFNSSLRSKRVHDWANLAGMNY